MAELMDYALAMKKISEEQAQKAREAYAKLRAAGIKKTVEEAAILCGVLSREQHAALAAEVETAWKVKVPKPDIAAVYPENEEAVATTWRRKGQRKEVEEALKRQEEFQAAGMQLPLWEIIEALGQEEGPDVQLGEAPQRSKFDKPPEAPKWLQKEEAAAPAPKPAPVPPKPAPRPGSGVKRAAPPAPPPKTGALNLLIAGVGAMCVILVIVIVVILSSRGGEEEPAKPPPKPKPDANADDRQKPPSLSPWADQVYAWQDRVNACGLWAAVEEMRGRKSNVQKLQQTMAEDIQKIQEKVREASAAKQSLPLGHMIEPTDSVTAVMDIKLWADNARLQEVSRQLEGLLRQIQGGHQVVVRLRRKGNPLEVTLQFHATPKWPDPK